MATRAQNKTKPLEDEPNISEIVRTSAAAAAERLAASQVLEPAIEFRGRTMRVGEPDEGQYAILIEAERWMERVQREHAAIGEIPKDAPDDHPGRVRLAELLKISKGHLGRMLTVLGTLFEDEADWDFIRDGLAEKTLTRNEVFELPVLIIQACRENRELKPDNRAAKRATAKAARAK